MDPLFFGSRFVVGPENWAVCCPPARCSVRPFVCRYVACFVRRAKRRLCTRNQRTGARLWPPSWTTNFTLTRSRVHVNPHTHKSLLELLLRSLLSPTTAAPAFASGIHRPLTLILCPSSRAFHPSQGRRAAAFPFFSFFWVTVLFTSPLLCSVTQVHNHLSLSLSLQCVPVCERQNVDEDGRTAAKEGTTPAELVSSS